MIIKLERYGSTPFGTFGEISTDNHKFYTVERPWLNNLREKSCIPSGVYDLKPHTRSNGDKVVALVNEDLGIYHYPNQKAHRDLILLHKANTMDDIIGCIGPGTGLGFIKNKWAITNSGNAMARIMDLFNKSNQNKIVITWQGSQ